MYFYGGGGGRRISYENIKKSVKHFSWGGGGLQLGSKYRQEMLFIQYTNAYLYSNTNILFKNYATSDKFIDA